MEDVCDQMVHCLRIVDQTTVRCPLEQQRRLTSLSKAAAAAAAVGTAARRADMQKPLSEAEVAALVKRVMSNLLDR